MRYLTIALLCLCAVPAEAGKSKLQTDLIDEGDSQARYVVAWQRGPWTVSWDSANKANKKVVEKSKDFCKAEGFERWRFAALGEIAEDETLRAAWDIATGGTGKTLKRATLLDPGNRVTRILILSKGEEATGEACK